MKESYSRRQFVAGVGAASAVALAGCGGSGDGGGDGGGVETTEPADGGGGETTETTAETTTTTTTESGGGGGGENVVAVGPDDELVFEPEQITVSSGDTVTWEFVSANHNVSAWPDMHEEISVPEGAEGFGTMAQGGDPYELVPEGETFQHTFETTGEFTYVCMPHVSTGMIGTVVVE